MNPINSCEVKEMNQGILSLLVVNHFGVLTKVTGLFSRRGYNIKSVSSGESQIPGLTRITVITEGDAARLRQICSQVIKLEDVKAAEILPEGSLVERELVLVKVSPAGVGGELRRIVGDFSAKTEEMPGGGMIIEASGPTRRMDELIALLKPLGVRELSRTGITALGLDERILQD